MNIRIKIDIVTCNWDEQRTVVGHNLRLFFTSFAIVIGMIMMMAIMIVGCDCKPNKTLGIWHDLLITFAFSNSHNE